ncbi:hypothetical protein STAQ_27580 [Allostella sp. ATCC 35155]|nr:hypothetical protein STAQ_27580 [Stella sp. ATCC 35155]
MANQKITDLPSLTGTPAQTILFEAVDDPAGTPTSKSVTLSKIFDGIPSLTDGGTAGRLDYFPAVLNASGASRYFRGVGLFGIINGLQETGTFALADELGLYQQNSSAARKRSLQQIYDLAALLATFSDPQTGDLAVVHDLSAGVTKAISLANLAAIVPQLTAFASTIDGAADLVALWDNSASAMRKLTPDQLFQVRQSVFIPAAAWTPRTTNGPAAGSAELSTNKRMVKSLDFDASTQEYAQFPVWLPKSWDLSTLAYRVAWTTATGTGGVTWSLAARADSDDDALDQAMGTAVLVADTRLADNDLHLTSESGALTAAGSAAEFDLVTFELSRAVADGGDTKTGDARFLGLQLYYNTRYRSDA